MRKHILFIVCGLLALTACKLEDTYTQTNVQDLVTVKGDNLINDFGYTLTVVQDAVGRANWQVEDARYFALYDVLNRQLDINLKEMVRSRYLVFFDYDESEEYPTDPIEPYLAAFSGGFLNVGFYITKAKNTNNAHPVNFYLQMDNNHLYLHVVHVGNGEDLRFMSKDDLTYEQRLYHVPVDEIPHYNQFTMVYHYLRDNGSGTPVLEEESYNIR
ncbi:MAG: hypothetical protein E7125_05445 [Bacteroidales bacterium]|jgi:hypothetical protein|nr:hypothetical protein [Bacteroidales bacterium]